MNLFFDTSALIKKYIDEQGSDRVDEILDQARSVYVSGITEIEMLSAVKRLLHDGIIDKNGYNSVKKEMLYDLDFFQIIELDKTVIETAKELIEKYQLKSLDSIQLGTVLSIKDEIDLFAVCDDKLCTFAKQEGIRIVNPNK
jgi:uncharacterized protein